MFALNARTDRVRPTRGFSLVELIAVMVVLAILAGVAAPRFFSYSNDAKSSSVQGTLGGVRTGLANYFANSSIAGTPAYPTLAELTTTGTVMQEPIPNNPYTNLKAVRQVNSKANADNRAVAQTAQYGWNYYVDNTATPPVCIFWANSTDATRVVKSSSNGNTIYYTANEL